MSDLVQRIELDDSVGGSRVSVYLWPAGHIDVGNEESMIQLDVAHGSCHGIAHPTAGQARQIARALLEAADRSDRETRGRRA